MSRSVLLIEDNEQNRYLVTFLLERSGFTVRAFADGAGGIEDARTRIPALILLDIQLPTMDGYAVARALRKHDALRGTPILAVTSYAMPGDRERALEAGCTSYIEKPINPETFVDEVERALSGSTQVSP
jgi:two-component system cell cycle response regulator DivK